MGKVLVVVLGLGVAGYAAYTALNKTKTTASGEPSKQSLQPTRDAVKKAEQLHQQRADQAPTE